MTLQCIYLVDECLVVLLRSVSDWMHMSVPHEHLWYTHSTFSAPQVCVVGHKVPSQLPRFLPPPFLFGLLRQGFLLCNFGCPGIWLTRLDSNSQRSACFSLLSSGIKGLLCHTKLFPLSFLAVS